MRRFLLPEAYSDVPVSVHLDLSDQVQCRLQRLFSRLPARGTDLALMLAHETGGLELAQDFFGAAADAVVVDVHRFDHAVGIDDERSTQRQADAFDVGAEVAAESKEC